MPTTSTAVSPVPCTRTPPKPSPLPSKARRRAGRRLTPARQFEDLRPLADSLRSRVIGQTEAVETLIASFSRLLSGLRDPTRPLLTALLLGPSGVGKTETARAVAYGLFGADKALTRINCEELAHSHQVAKLLGSPPGYIGQEVEPLLSQGRIDEPHLALRRSAMAAGSRSLVEHISAQNAGEPISVVLFDEIEKAHPVVWSSLLGVLEEGSLTLGDNRTTDLTRAIVLMTSNIGSRELGELLDPSPMGFSAGVAATAGRRSLRDAVLDAARRHFPLEFLNRFDETLVYTALDRQDLEGIFGKFLGEIHQRALNQAKTPLHLEVSPAAAERIIDRGTDAALGARPLRRVMEREIVDPLSRLIASRQLEAEDVVEIVEEGGALAFYRKRRESQRIHA